jgi:hypothetical protein
VRASIDRRSEAASVMPVVNGVVVDSCACAAGAMQATTTEA